MSTAPTPPDTEECVVCGEWLGSTRDAAALRGRVEDLELMLRSMLCGGWMAVEVAGGPGDGRIALVPHDMRDEDADPYGDAAQDAFKKAEQLSLDDRGIPILTPESRAALKGRPS